MRKQPGEGPAEARFRTVFAHLGGVVAYARRRGSADPEALAAEVMAIAWRRLADVPQDPRPWLFATARNLLLAEWRRRQRTAAAVGDAAAEVADAAPAPEVHAMDPDVESALRALSPDDREALVLIAWEELSPGQAADVLGLSHTAFRVRLHRARRRFRADLETRRDARPRPAAVQAMGLEPR